MPNSNGTSYRTVYAFAREMHPKTVKTDIQYGTAGFRTKATNLGYVMYRMGLLAVLRARYKNATIGAMITASHNPECDNGIKLVDPMGEMLEEEWEYWATKFANVGDDQLEGLIKEIVTKYSIPMTDRVQVFVGKDTRPSSPSLAKSLMDGILALSGKPVDYGIVTTPQLHYFVLCKNTKRAYGEYTEEGYYTKLAGSFAKLRDTGLHRERYRDKVFYDGANGVGAKKIKYFQELLNGGLDIEMFNDAAIGSGKLNHLCGADYVKSNQTFPTGVPREANVRCCSVDGDADRVVYYYLDGNNGFHLMDGDRIATLIVGHLKELLAKTGIDLNLGLVQTAYANYASTDYSLNRLKVSVACTKTGVKHLHHKALEYDIGVYFEANGHGTVVFSTYAKDTLKKLRDDDNANEEKRTAAKQLLNFIDIVNEAVGDAISDMLLVETILHAKDWDIQDWEAEYTDLPNTLMKIKVQDRNMVKTTDAERKVAEPEGLQQQIDEIVAKYEKGRSFIRPSGTEDIVRIYAEADSKQNADGLASEVAALVEKALATPDTAK